MYTFLNHLDCIMVQSRTHINQQTTVPAVLNKRNNKKYNLPKGSLLTDSWNHCSTTLVKFVTTILTPTTEELFELQVAFL